MRERLSPESRRHEPPSPHHGCHSERTGPRTLFRSGVVREGSAVAPLPQPPRRFRIAGDAAKMPSTAAATADKWLKARAQIGCYSACVSATPPIGSNGPLTRATRSHPRVVRNGLSLFFACLITLPLEGIADKGHLPGFIVLMLAPGYVIGSFISMQVHSFGEALQIMGYTSLSVDLIYWSSIFFGLFSVWARTRERRIAH